MTRHDPKRPHALSRGKKPSFFRENLGSSGLSLNKNSDQKQKTRVIRPNSRFHGSFSVSGAQDRERRASHGNGDKNGNGGKKGRAEKNGRERRRRKRQNRAKVSMAAAKWGHGRRPVIRHWTTPLAVISSRQSKKGGVVALELPRRRTRASRSIRYPRVSSVVWCVWKAAWATVPVASPTAMSSVSFGPRSSR